MCETSNTPAARRTAWCSPICELYCTGMSQPPKSTMRAPSSWCRSNKGVCLPTGTPEKCRGQKKSGRRCASREAPAALLSFDLRDQAPEAPLPFGGRVPGSPGTRHSPEAPRFSPPSAVHGPERFRAELRLRRSGAGRTLSEQTVSGRAIIAAPAAQPKPGDTVEFTPSPSQPRVASMSIDRRSSVQVCIGPVRVGGGAPVVVQSMTNTDTADVAATTRQVQALAARRLGAGARDREHGRGRRRGRARSRRAWRAWA